MIVTIGESVFDSEKIQVRIQLSDREKLQIQHMPIEHDIYEPGIAPEITPQLELSEDTRKQTFGILKKIGKE